jgi:hypothetical protein
MSVAELPSPAVRRQSRAAGPDPAVDALEVGDPCTVTGADLVEVILDVVRGGERPAWWGQRDVLCWDIPERIVEEAAYEFVRDQGEFGELQADESAYRALCDLISTADAPGGISNLAEISDEQIDQANERWGTKITRRQTGYWIARQRFAFVDAGIPLEAVAPELRIRFQAVLPPIRRSFTRVVARRRAPRRRIRGTARSPDDPSRLGHNRVAAGRCRQSWPAPSPAEQHRGAESCAARVVTVARDSWFRRRRSA